MTISGFQGFAPPEQNWTKLPNVLIEAFPMITSLGELKVLLYVLRHTWGFQEFDPEPKKITIDEFEHGRKRRDGSRLDSGTGLSKNTILDGLERAEAHGFLLIEVDDSDAARIKKSYCLNMLGVQKLNPAVQKLNPGGSKVEQRSEKETIERKERKTAASPRPPSGGSRSASISDPDSDGIYTANMIDESDEMIGCPACGEDIDIRAQPNSRGTCPGCGVGIRIRDPHGRVIKKGKRSLQTLGMFPDSPPWAKVIQLRGNQVPDCRAIHDVDPDMFWECIEWANDKVRAAEMPPNRLISAALGWAQKRLRNAESEQRRFIQGNPWEMTAGERLDFWASWLPALYVLPEDKVAELAAEMGLQKRGDLWYNRNGDLLDPETHSVDWKESPEWKQ